MSSVPLVSFLVLSYNYAQYLSQTLNSILAQTVGDFEVIVVDDCSTDESVAVIQAIRDPRVRLIVNDANIGGAASYNRAVEEARGVWLANLDADDWIAPQKLSVQLQYAETDPTLDVIGTYVTIVDASGGTHSRASGLETAINQERDFGCLDTWLASNYLCRSSTIVRRTAHLALGLDDPSMVRAPDYELWTRFFARGRRFAVVPQRLTFLRVHDRGVTHASPVESLLEISYAMLRNLIPVADRMALIPSYERMMLWSTRHPHIGELPPPQACRLLGMMLLAAPVNDYQSFRAAIADHDEDSVYLLAGRRCLALLGEDLSDGWRKSYQSLATQHAQLQRILLSVQEDAAFWRRQSASWEGSLHRLISGLDGELRSGAEQS